MKERWISLDPQFPRYSVSDLGNVFSERRGRLMSQFVTTSGLTKVALRNQDGKQIPSLVAHLVLRSFEPNPRPGWNTPIYLNGDRTDNRLCNLQWRTRSFAILYHRRLNFPPLTFKHPIRIIETGEEFYGFREPAMKYGMLEEQIADSLNYGFGVIPNGYHFEEGY